MRQLILLSVFVLIAAPAFTQEPAPTEGQQPAGQEYYYEDDELFQEDREEVETVTHAEFAVMVLQVLAGDQDSVPGPSESFAICLNRGLVPSNWVGTDILTHEELAEFMRRMGAGSLYILSQHNPPNPDEPASKDYVEVMLRRALGEIKDYRYTLRLGGEDPYRGVSPAGF
jgi:hypothetical protein